MNEKIAQKLKEAMLVRDSFLTDTLKGLKSAILYEAVAKGKKDEGLNDEEVLVVISREVKKRNDAAKIFADTGNKESSKKEAAEAKVLSEFLPEQLSEDELNKIIDEIIKELGAENMKDMGRVIGAVKAKVGVAGDGAIISSLVKNKLQ